MGNISISQSNTLWLRTNVFKLINNLFHDDWNILFKAHKGTITDINDGTMTHSLCLFIMN